MVAITSHLISAVFRVRKGTRDELVVVDAVDFALKGFAHAPRLRFACRQFRVLMTLQPAFAVP